MSAGDRQVVIALGLPDALRRGLASALQSDGVSVVASIDQAPCSGVADVVIAPLEASGSLSPGWIRARPVLATARAVVYLAGQGAGGMSALGGRNAFSMLRLPITAEELAGAVRSALRAGRGQGVPQPSWRRPSSLAS
jgi:hypothetical protein